MRRSRRVSVARDDRRSAGGNEGAENGQAEDREALSENLRETASAARPKLGSPQGTMDASTERWHQSLLRSLCWRDGKHLARGPVIPFNGDPS